MNWRTTTAAIFAALGIILTQLGYGLDDNPDTITNWDIVMKALGAILTAIGITSLGFFSRDKKVSDEQSGAGVE